MSDSASGTAGCTSAGGVGRTARWQWTSSMASEAAKGGRPVSIS